MSVKIDYRSISWGGPNEDDNIDVWALEDGVTDPGSVVLEKFGIVGDPVEDFPAPATYQKDGNTLEFAFWNATNGISALPGYPSADPQRKLNVPAQPDGTVIHATAWFAPPSGSGGPGKPHLRARTFDVDLNGFRKETPILSATPQGAWPGPNHHSVFAEAAAANVTPKAELLYPAPFSSQPPGEPSKQFKYWQPVVGPLTINGYLASCPKGQSALALAFFGHSIELRGLLNLEREQDYWGELLSRL